MAAEGEASRFQEAALVAPPSYPNAVAWSQENLIAVASGHLVTVLNPALPSGPRGLITIQNGEPYPIGLVKREELLTGGLLPVCLNRESRPCVRSLSWSHLGMAPNYGCLLAACTAEGRVKLYRPPFCDFCAEWIEIVDITDMLYDYLSSVEFGESNSASSKLSKEQSLDYGLASNGTNSVVLKECKRRRVSRGKIIPCGKNSVDPSHMKNSEGIDDGLMIPTNPDGQEVSEVDSNKLAKNFHKVFSMSKAQKKVFDKTHETLSISLIRADQYASRSAMLSTVVVAWSPMLRLSPEICPTSSNDQSNCFSLLAVGAKSGKISLWKIHAPECYSIEHSNVSTSLMLLGLLEAHSSWITTLSWAIIRSDSSNPQLLLATGSSDGSVKIWTSYGEALQKSSEVNRTPFTLLNEVIAVNPIPASALSLIVPVQSPNRMFLAIGKGSGSFEVWICDIAGRKLEKAGTCDAHDHVVTGLAWAFDGRCLYSCSQDNFVRSWILHGKSLSEVPIPPNTPGLSSTADLPDSFLSCLGVALSPANLVVALVRSFNIDLLDQMYQARAQKAAVEFIWNGGQQCVVSSDSLENGMEAFPGFNKKELVYWESNFLWSLKQYEHVHEPLVLWDVVAALLAFKQSIPEYVEYMVTKWLSASYLGSHLDVPLEEILPRISKSLSKVPSRLLHVLNVISRRVILSEIKADHINSRLQNLRVHDAEDEQLALWLELLLKSERELRERLVALSFSSSLIIESCSTPASSHPGCWSPAGLPQMEQWVALNPDHVHDQLKSLASEIKTHMYKRSDNASEYAAEENCPYCSALVPFDSPEVASCQGPFHKHELKRCAVSMQVCPATPSWFCKCCHRWTSKLPPQTLLSLPSFPSDVKSLPEPSVLKAPLCPFCGIMLQRLQPEFLLSPSPV